jgi:hypothetical protein
VSDAAFTHDVILSHSAKDKTVARRLAERLRQDGCAFQPLDFGPQAFRCAPLQQERRLITLSLDDAGLSRRRSLEVSDPRDAKNDILAALRSKNA